VDIAPSDVSTVRAAHDIERGRRIAVQVGSPGWIVNLQTGWADTTYTVEFRPVVGATVTLVGLTGVTFSQAE
jgi:hypothetical protein